MIGAALFLLAVLAFLLATAAVAAWWQIRAERLEYEARVAAAGKCHD